MDSTVYKKYIPCEGKGVNYLKVELYYDKGGYSYFTYKETARGYFLSVTPVERSDRGGYFMESITLFHGVKKLIRPVARKNDKLAYNEISKEALMQEQELIDYVCEHEGIKVVLPKGELRYV